MLLAFVVSVEKRRFSVNVVFQDLEKNFCFGLKSSFVRNLLSFCLDCKFKLWLILYILYSHSLYLISYEIWSSFRVCGVSWSQ